MGIIYAIFHVLDEHDIRQDVENSWLPDTEASTLMDQEENPNYLLSVW